MTTVPISNYSQLRQICCIRCFTAVDLFLLALCTDIKSIPDPCCAMLGVMHALSFSLLAREQSVLAVAAVLVPHKLCNMMIVMRSLGRARWTLFILSLWFILLLLHA